MRFTDFDQKYEKEAKIEDNETLFAFKDEATSSAFENWLDAEGWELFGAWLEPKSVVEPVRE